MQPSSKIVAILRVEDTREWIEDPDGRWRALAGSGVARSCDRCQRAHEVHATVELENGRLAVVGTGCMRTEDAETVRALRRADRAAKRARCAIFEGAKRARMAQAYVRARALVDALELPPVTEGLEKKGGGTVLVLRMGDAEVWHLGNTLNALDRPERVQSLTQAWRTNRLAELGIGLAHRVAFHHYPA